MKELGPPLGLPAAAGLSVKALRLYDERGPLVPAVSTGPPGTAGAPKIRSLQRAGSHCCAGRHRPGRPRTVPGRTAAVVIDRWLADLEAETSLRRRALALAIALGLDTSPPREPAMAVIIRPAESPTELAPFKVAGAQFDAAIDHIDQRRFAELEAAYRRAGAGDDLAPGLFRRRGPVVVDLDEPSPVVRAQVEDLVR
jgi:hypothetical protein